MRTRAILFFCFGLSFSGMSQERFGISHSNYGGADATYLNPARSAGQWPFVDLRVVGVDLFAWNSLVAWSGREQPLIGELRSSISVGNTNGVAVLRDASSNNMHRGFEQANVLGPAFSISLGRGTIGAGIRTRTFTSVTGVSPAMGNFIFNGLGYTPQHGIRYTEQGIRVVSAAWTEFAVNYAHILKAEGFGMFSAGITAKYNLGHFGGALQFDELDYMVVDSALLQVHEVTASYGYATPTFNAGSGWGADLGVSYERTIDEADGYLPHRGSGGCDPLRYRYRIGLSIIDLGGIKFKNGEAGSIRSGPIDIADYSNVTINSQEDIDSLFATATQWKRNETFSVGTPTALALQYDQRAAEHVYVALAAVQQVRTLNGTRLRRSNSVALTPRFETKHAEVALPVVMHEYDVRHPSVGIMLRFEGVVVGSDHIMPFLNRRDVYAADVYFRLRLMLHRSPFCKGKRKSTGEHRAGSREQMPCSTPNQ